MSNENEINNENDYQNEKVFLLTNIFHSIPNNPNNKVIPNDIEATYVRKGFPRIIWSNSEVNLPLDIDEPNDLCRPDLILGKWNCDWK